MHADSANRWLVVAALIEAVMLKRLGALTLSLSVSYVRCC